jgi:hypothetical protein
MGIVCQADNWQEGGVEEEQGGLVLEQEVTRSTSTERKRAISPNQEWWWTLMNLDHLNSHKVLTASLNKILYKELEVHLATTNVFSQSYLTL